MSTTVIDRAEVAALPPGAPSARTAGAPAPAGTPPRLLPRGAEGSDPGHPDGGRSQARAGVSRPGALGKVSGQVSGEGVGSLTSPVTCRNCGAPRARRVGRRRKWRGARGWCGPCYQRWLRAGKPAGGPPPRKVVRYGSVVICSNCGRENQPHAGHGWCSRCYSRWRHAGRPADGPPSSGPAARREDYYWLRDEQGLTIGQAAERVGICHRTAQRYEARRKAVAS
jgi:hypothetical protein